MTALSPPKGAEGDLQKFRETCSFQKGWLSPLPLAVPLKLFSLSFPRDRVDPQSLKELPPLSLSGPASRNGNMILEMKEMSQFHEEGRLFRMIHGKKVPEAAEESFIGWDGLLLAPSGSYSSQDEGIENREEVKFHFRTWQLGLYKIRYNEKRLWWEDFSWSCLWKVRKPSS